MGRGDYRYHSTQWPKRRDEANALTRGRCVRCLRRSFNVHHAYYGIRVFFIPLPISGCEIPLWQCFPLCSGCHQGHAHLGKHWRVSWVSPWLDRNAWGYIWYLRLCAAITLVRLWVIPALIGLAALVALTCVAMHYLFPGLLMGLAELIFS